MPNAFPRLQPLGDAALLVELGSGIDPDLNRRVHALAARLMAATLPGVVEIVPAYASALIHYDPLVLDFTDLEAWAIAALDGLVAASFPPRRVEIPVRYGGADGPDLEFVAAHAGLTPAAVIRLHSAAEYTVYMMGFQPGFPYLGGLNPAIAAPRLPTPRTRVPAGSVGIAGNQTGIYPSQSPGGWRLIGRTDLRLFDPSADPPCLLNPGDIIRFVPVTPC